MLSAGHNVTDNTHPLAKITVEYLYDKLRNPRSDLVAMIRQLRTVKRLDAKRYAVAKRQLPYVCCGIFNPAFRNSQNFAYAQHFIIDIDHLSDKGLDAEVVKQRLSQDPRVALAFLSPSEDGIKVLFNLNERCTDPGLYSHYYREFAHAFAATHNLEQVIDRCTSDVARACFISWDPQAYFNPDAETLVMSRYLDIDNVASLEKENRLHLPPVSQPARDPDDETMERIRLLLAGKKKQALTAKPPVEVPDELNQVMPAIEAILTDNGITVNSVENIQYGKKIKLSLGVKRAELNIFYGKRGFSIVKSPRCGTSAQLNDLTAQLIATQLY